LSYIRAVIDLRSSVLMMVALAGALGGCGRGADRSAVAPPPIDAKASSPPAAPAPAEASKPAPAAEVPVVVLAAPGHDPVRVTVEIANTDELRRRGLMYRQNLAPDAGMLFLFPMDEIHQFWMKNTLIPLDMIFIRKDGTVAGVVENAEPKTLDGRSVGKESRHVLEVNGGFARLHGIGEGTRVSYEHVDLTGFDK
jgi:uncharacterized membrane protein (UPF0127 family)